MKFVFVSHGISQLAFKQITKLVGKEPKDTKVLFITTPANAYPPNPPWLIDSKEELIKAGYQLTEFDIEAAYKNQTDIKAAITRYDIVAVSGGNTFYFLYWAEKVGLKAIFQEFLSQGGVYMGESAGVVCQIKDLEPIKWADKPEVAPEIVKQGLQLTQMVVIPHWNNPKYQATMAKIKTYYEDKGLYPFVLEDGEVMTVKDNGIVLIKANETETIDTFSAGGVVVNSKGQVCVVNQDNRSWSLPKGHINPGEHPLHTAKREIKEEAGITELEFMANLGTYSRHKINQDLSEVVEIRKNMIMFLFKTNQEKLHPIDPENPEARWVDKDKVADLLTHPKDKEFYLDVLKKYLIS